MSERYIATFRAQFTTEDDVEAQLVAADILEAVAQANILEESDSINVTQIVPMGLSLTAEEVATQLRLARNLLIKTRIGPLFELAKEIHQAAWILENRREDTMDLSGFDYGSFFDAVEEVFNDTNKS